MHNVNDDRKVQSEELPRSWLGWLNGKLGMICMSPVHALDWLRMWWFHTLDMRTFASEQRRLKIHDVMSRLDNDQLPWTMDTAFYAICGGAVVLIENRIRTLSPWAIENLAAYDPKCLLPLQRAVLQDPSKASGLAKFITCAQAFWFCSQCIARLSQNMAISLLELNTFAHCISAFFIYVFWWSKPYDVATHVYITTYDLNTHMRSRNMGKEMFSSIDWAIAGFWRPLVMILTFLIYGAMHSLAWQYHFPTDAEGITWRCASVATASSGLILLLTIFRGSDWAIYHGHADSLLHLVVYLLGFVAVAARSFLIFESFRALPNSPASIYEIPKWTAYIPHI